MYPKRHAVYTLAQVFQLELDDSPYLEIHRNGLTGPIQNSHLTVEQLLSVPGLAESTWIYRYTTNEWIPVFEHAGSFERELQHCLEVAEHGEGLWITPNGFPRECPTGSRALSTTKVDAEAEADEPICESISPHGNRCMFIAGHNGSHEIQHMLGEETWGSDKHPDLYYCVVD